jgi:hypothetical protein
VPRAVASDWSTLPFDTAAGNSRIVFNDELPSGQSQAKSGLEFWMMIMAA